MSSYLLLEVSNNNLIERETNFVMLNWVFGIDRDHRLFLEEDGQYIPTDIIVATYTSSHSPTQVHHIKVSCGTYFILDINGNLRAIHKMSSLSKILASEVLAFTTFLYDNDSYGYPTGIVYISPKGLIGDRLDGEGPMIIDLPHLELIKEFESVDCECYGDIDYKVVYILDKNHRLFFNNKMIASNVENVFLFSRYTNFISQSLWYITDSHGLYQYRPWSQTHHLIAIDVSNALVYANRVCYLTRAGVLSCYCPAQEHHQLLFTQVTRIHIEDHHLYVLVKERFLYRAYEGREVTFELCFKSPHSCRSITHAHLNKELFLLELCEK